MNSRLWTVRLAAFCLLVSAIPTMVPGQECPQHTGSISWNWPGPARNVVVEGEYAYVVAQQKEWFNCESFSLLVVDLADPAAPQLIGEVESTVPGCVTAFEVTDGVGYVTTVDSLAILDLSEPTRPEVVAEYEMTDRMRPLWGAQDVAVAGDLVFVALMALGELEPACVIILDASDPAQPTEVGRIEAPESDEVWKVAVSAGHAYMATGYTNGLVNVVDVSDPEAPVDRGRLVTHGRAAAVTLVGDLAMVAAGTAGLRIADTTASAGPVELGYLADGTVARDVVMSGAHAVVLSSEYGGVEGGLSVVDMSDPTAPHKVGTWEQDRAPSALAVVGHLAYLTARFDVPGEVRGVLRVIDLADPENLVEVGHVELPSEPLDVLVSGHYAYVADGWAGLRIVDVSDPTAPVEVGNSVAPRCAVELAMSGSMVWVVEGMYGFGTHNNNDVHIIDVADPTQPVELLHWQTENVFDALAFSEGYGFFGTSEGVSVYDVSAPTGAVLVTEVGDVGEVTAVAVDGGSVVVASEQAVEILDRRCLNTRWMDIAAHQPGLFDSEWRTDLVALNQADESASAEIVLHTGAGEHSLAVPIPGGSQVVVEDVLGMMDLEGKGLVEVRSDRPLIVLGRTYNTSETGTYGQFVDGVPEWNPTGPIPNAPLLGLRQLGQQFRTNLTFANVGVSSSAVEIKLRGAGGGDDSGYDLAVYEVELGPEEMVQDLEPFRNRAGRPDVGWGHALVSGAPGVLVSASVVDSRTNDATTVPVTVEPVYELDSLCPSMLARILEGAGCVAVDSSYAYVGDYFSGARWSNSMFVVSIAEPSSPQVVGTVDLGLPSSMSIRSIAVSGQHVYTADGSEGLYVIDVSDPTEPTEVGSVTIEDARDVAVQSGFAYVASSRSGLRVLDLAEPANPVEVARRDLWAETVSVRGNRALVTDGFGNLRIYDVSRPSAPVEVGRYSMVSNSGMAVVSGDLALVADGSAGLEIVDLSCLDEQTLSTRYWIEIAAHETGVFGSEWRTDLVLRRAPSPGEASVEVVLHTEEGEFSLSNSLESMNQAVFEDVVGLMGREGKGVLEVRSDAHLALVGRIYNDTGAGTYGQALRAYGTPEGLRAGESAWLPGLRQDEGLFRTNLSVTNTGDDPVTVTITLFAGDGGELVSYELNVEPKAVVQDLEPFKERAEEDELGWGFARVTATTGSGILTSASVIDSRTNDATTIPMRR